MSVRAVSSSYIPCSQRGPDGLSDATVLANCHVFLRATFSGEFQPWTLAHPWTMKATLTCDLDAQLAEEEAIEAEQAEQAAQQQAEEMGQAAEEEEEEEVAQPLPTRAPAAGAPARRIAEDDDDAMSIAQAPIARGNSGGAGPSGHGGGSLRRRLRG